MAKRFIVMLALAALMMSVSSALVAQEKEVKVIVSDNEESAACARGMKLTDEQRAKVEELRTEQRLRAIELRADLAKLDVELQRETDKNEPNMTSVEATLKKMSAVRERSQMNRIKHDLAMRKLLGDDWRARVRPGGGDDMMWIEAEAEENSGRGEREVRVMRFRDRDGRESMHRERLAPGACCPARGTREFKILRARSGRAACHADGARKNNWDSRMFRPRGKGTDRCCSGDCRHMECQRRLPEECRHTMDPTEL